ncbi:MAG: hypothetical protein K2X97_22195 [Mycobacteriaceae bacterium]|nr:hypothetical protein [Mycobacteriaceae bacterium]
MTAIEAAEYGLRINTVSPCFAQHKFLDKTTSAELLDQLSSRGRAGEAPNRGKWRPVFGSEYLSYLSGKTISVSNEHA